MADEPVNQQHLFKKIFGVQGLSPDFNRYIDQIGLGGAGGPGATAFLSSMLKESGPDPRDMANALEQLQKQGEQFNVAMGMISGITQARVQEAQDNLGEQVAALREVAEKVGLTDRGSTRARGGRGRAYSRGIDDNTNAGGKGPGSPPIDDNTNKTSQEIARAANARITGEGPIERIIKNTLGQIPGAGPAVNMALGQYDRFQGRFPQTAQTFERGALGATAIIGAPLVAQQAAQRIEQVYGHLAGQDITYGQGLGLQGSQGVGAFGDALRNKLMTPLNLLTGGSRFFGGEAQQFGAQKSLEAVRAGINPFDALSIDQSKSIQKEVFGRGYRAKTPQSEEVIRGLFRLRNETGGDSGQALDYLDLMVKRLGMNVTDTVDTLSTFGSAARAAGKSIDEYTKEVTEVTKNLVNANVPGDAASLAGQGFAAIQGVSGTALAGITDQGGQDPFLMQQALMANPNMSAGDTLRLIGNSTAFFGENAPESAITSLRATIDRFQPMFPDQSREQIIELLKANNILPPGYANLDAKSIALADKYGDSASRVAPRGKALKAAQIGYKSAKNVPKGGASAFDFTHPNAAAIYQKTQDQLTGVYGDYQTQIGKSRQAHDLTKAQYADIRGRIARKEDPAEIEKIVNEDISITQAKREQKDNNAANRITIDASDTLKKFFKFMDASGNSNLVTSGTVKTISERSKSKENTAAIDRLRGMGVGG